MKQLLRKYKLVGSITQGKFLIPGPPIKALTPFLVYLVEEQKKIKSEINEKAEQQDIIKLLNIKYKTMTQQEKAKYAEGYKIEVQKYFQRKRDYDNSFNFGYYRGVKTIESAYQMLKRSTIQLRDREKQKIEIVNEKFGKLQHHLYDHHYKDATQEEIEITQQIFNLIQIHQIQIKLNCEQYKIPQLLNTYQLKDKCQDFVKTYVRYQRSDIPFQQFLLDEVKVKQVKYEQYVQELKLLSQKHNEIPEKVEFALVCLMAKDNKQKEEITRKRKLKSEKSSDFIDLLSEYLE